MKTDKIESAIMDQKVIIGRTITYIQCCGPRLNALPQGAVEIGHGIHEGPDGRLYTVLPGQYVCGTYEEPRMIQYARDHATTVRNAIAEIARLEGATVTTVDVIESATAKSRETGKMQVLRYGTTVAVAVDATAGTVTFGWRSPAGYSDDPMSFTGGLLPASEDHNYNEAICQLADRAEIERMAKKLNVSLTHEEIK